MILGRCRDLRGRGLSAGEVEEKEEGKGGGDGGAKEEGDTAERRLAEACAPREAVEAVLGLGERDRQSIDE